MNEIRIRAVIKRTGCRNELHTPFCRKQQSKIEVLYKYVIVHGGSNCLEQRNEAPKRCLFQNQ